MSVPLERRRSGLTISNRHPRWLERYAPGFWMDWHMSLIGHNSRPWQRPVTFMDALYQTHTQKSAAASELLGFEARTVLGHLPAQSGATTGLLQAFAEDLEGALDLRPFWTTLDAHFDKHVRRGDSGPFLEAAASACMQHLAQTVGLSEQERADLEPGAVDTPERYARLARLITLLALAEERPFPISLYCASSEYEPVHALALNIQVPPAFLSTYGASDEREVLVGLTLAGKDQVPGPGGGVSVPVLVPDQYFSTLFAPTPRQGARMSGDGRSCHLIL